MDSRNSPHHHHNHHQQQQTHHHQQQQQQQNQQHHPFPHGLMSSYGLPNNHSLSSPNSGNMMNPNFRYPFNHIMSSAATNSKPFDSSITNNNNSNSDNHNKSSMSNNGLSYDSGLPQSSFSLEQQQSGEKKKRGRPRKCAADGTIALGLSSGAPNSSIGDDDISPPPVVVSAPPPCGDSPVKRSRGRPPGTGKKQLDALGPGGVGFTPHVIMCQPGEDIASKIVAFSQQATRTVCILSANGAISSVTLKQPSLPCGTVKYEDRFQIISLSGSFTFSESNGDRSRNGGLTISFAGKDDQVLGGSVAGALTAATPVQVIVASFAPDVKKPNSNTSASKPSTGPPGKLLNFGGPMAAAGAAAAAASPSSNGDGSNDSSDENGSSPLDGTAYGQTYNNDIQPIHGIPYQAMNWPPNR